MIRLSGSYGAELSINNLRRLLWADVLTPLLHNMLIGEDVQQQRLVLMLMVLLFDTQIQGLDTISASHTLSPLLTYMKPIYPDYDNSTYDFSDS